MMNGIVLHQHRWQKAVCSRLLSLTHQCLCPSWHYCQFCFVSCNRPDQLPRPELQWDTIALCSFTACFRSCVVCLSSVYLDIVSMLLAIEDKPSVKQLVQALQANKDFSHIEHSTYTGPWGSLAIFYSSHSFKISQKFHLFEELSCCQSKHTPIVISGSCFFIVSALSSGSPGAAAFRQFGP